MLLASRSCTIAGRAEATVVLSIVLTRFGSGEGGREGGSRSIAGVWRPSSMVAILERVGWIGDQRGRVLSIERESTRRSRVRGARR